MSFHSKFILTLCFIKTFITSALLTQQFKWHATVFTYSKQQKNGKILRSFDADHHSDQDLDQHTYRNGPHQNFVKLCLNQQQNAWNKWVRFKFPKICWKPWQYRAWKWQTQTRTRNFSWTKDALNQLTIEQIGIEAEKSNHFKDIAMVYFATKYRHPAHKLNVIGWSSNWQFV